MATDMFLKIEGEDIKGESRDEAHRDEIDVLSWSWGMTQSGSSHIGGGGGAGKVNIQDLAIEKYIDKASPKLMQGCASGKHYDKATLTLRKAGGDSLEYLVIEMSHAMIASIDTGGSGNEERLTERVLLNFAKVKTKYTPERAAGGAEGSIEFGWDIEANTPI